jgi:hypothetical protein
VADRDVTVNVNLGSGQDTLTPALEKQRQKAEELQRQIDKIKGVDPDPEGAAEKKLERLERQLKSLNREMAAGAATPGVGQFSGAEVYTATERYREQQRQALLRAVGQAQVTGVIPANQITAVGPGGSRAGVVSGVAGAVGAAASGSVAGVAGGVSSALAGLGLAQAGAAVGAFGAVLGAVVTVGQTVVSAFSRVRDSADSMVAAFNQNLSDLQAGRQRGTAGREALTRALEPGEQTALAAAQAANDPARQQAILRQAEARLQAQAGAEGPRAAARVAQLQTDLQAVEEHIRSTVFRTNPLAPSAEQLRQQAFRRAGVAEGAIPATGNAPAIQEQIRQWAQIAAGGSVQAQAGLEAVRNAMRPGGMPSLSPGALTLQDLPNLFQSRQTDVLETHAQIQQDLVRDARQQAQFERQMEIWERIYRTILNPPWAPPANPGGGVSGGIGGGFGAPWAGDGGIGGGIAGAAAAPP